jgi:hypothetical protein
MHKIVALFATKAELFTATSNAQEMMYYKRKHAENSRFAGNSFMNDVEKSGQTLSFCGVNAYFQNGIAEKIIRDLQDQTRKQLLRNKAIWPRAITNNTLVYTLRNTNHFINSLPDKIDRSSPA